MNEKDIAAITSNPAMHFSSPQELAQTDRLQHAPKVQALQQWESEIRQLMVASEENMMATTEATLQDVHEALRALGVEVGNRDGVASKSGEREYNDVK